MIDRKPSDYQHYSCDSVWSSPQHGYKQQNMQEEASNDSITRLDERYQDNVRPYETIVKTIALHNNQIYYLQEKYKQLQKQYDELRQNVQPSPLDEERKKERQRELKKERNRFIEEAITAREKDFNDQYKSKRLQRLEEISLKYQQISLMQGHERKDYNIFFNLDEGLLEEVIHELAENGEEPLKKELAVWLTSYNTSMNAKLK